MNTEQKLPQYLYAHTKHRVILVRTVVEKSQNMKVTYAKTGILVDDVPTMTQSFEDQHLEVAPRLSFAGRIIHQTSENIEIHIGVSMSTPRDQFSRRKGRSIATKRAVKCPVLIIYCLDSEAIGVFHKAVERLTPDIMATKVTMLKEPHEVTMSLTEILAEETAD